jgi:uncharacterized protein YcgL (UPF0745 family)
MRCHIYKSLKKRDAYLYIENQDDFSRVPKTLLDMLSRLELVMSLDLSEAKRLAQAEPAQVMSLLKEQGYFLQMPPRIETMQ